MKEGQSAAAGAAGSLGGEAASGGWSAPTEQDADTATLTASSDTDPSGQSASSTVSNPTSDIEPEETDGVEAPTDEAELAPSPPRAPNSQRANIAGDDHHVRKQILGRSTLHRARGSGPFFVKNVAEVLARSTYTEDAADRMKQPQ
jgi:hypothetical protein